MPKTRCLRGTFLRTSVRSRSPYSTTRFSVAGDLFVAVVPQGAESVESEGVAVVVGEFRIVVVHPNLGNAEIETGGGGPLRTVFQYAVVSGRTGIDQQGALRLIESVMCFQTGVVAGQRGVESVRDLLCVQRAALDANFVDLSGKRSIRQADVIRGRPVAPYARRGGSGSEKRPVPIKQVVASAFDPCHVDPFPAEVKNPFRTFENCVPSSPLESEYRPPSDGFTHRPGLLYVPS